MTGHAVLQIIKGVQKTPGDNFSAEQGLDIVDFLDAKGGFALDAYEMKIPALKSSAVYADSPLTDGRTLISGALGNVNETIRVTLSVGTIVQLSAMLSKLLRFKQNCNDFWDTFYQIEPVYIKHQVSGEPGPRYALLYDIDIALSDPTNPSEPTRDVTVVIEREYGWRGIAPGANPQQWTAYKNKQRFSVANSSLANGGNHLISGQIMNGIDLTTINQVAASNVLTIPAAKIDGDLPALTFVHVDTNGSTADVILARDTRPATLPDSVAGVNQLRRLCITGSAGDVNGLDTTFVNDTGANRYIPSSVSGRRVETTFATTATDSLRWFEDVDITTFRGRYMMFARARQFNGAQGNIEYYVTLSHSGVFYTSPIVNPLLTGGTGNSVNWNLDYLGIVTLPVDNRSLSQVNKGAGLAVSNPENSLASTITNVRFNLMAARIAATTARLAFNDIVLIPIDEYAVLTNSSSYDNILFDNTGYLTHGGTEGVVEKRSLLGTSEAFDSSEFRGNTVMLKPKTDNQLITITKIGDSNLSNSVALVNVYVDIVPRWSGLRDV